MQRQVFSLILDVQIFDREKNTKLSLHNYNAHKNLKNE